MWEHLIPALIDLTEGTLLLCSKVDSDLGLGDATYRILSCPITRRFPTRLYPITGTGTDVGDLRLVTKLQSLETGFHWENVTFTVGNQILITLPRQLWFPTNHGFTFSAETLTTDTTDISKIASDTSLFRSSFTWADPAIPQGSGGRSWAPPYQPSSPPFSCLKCKVLPPAASSTQQPGLTQTAGGRGSFERTQQQQLPKWRQVGKQTRRPPGNTNVSLIFTRIFTDFVLLPLDLTLSDLSKSKPRVIRLSLRAAPLKKVWLLSGPPLGKFFQTTTSDFSLFVPESWH